MNRLAIDIGGTFTDVVLERSSEQFAEKRLTTHEDPTLAVRDGMSSVLSSAGVEPSELDLVIHGTTLATNAIIERKGARTALLTTEGHRDILEMAFENRFEQYDINIDRPEPLVPRYLRLPIRERMNFRGHVLRALDDASIDAAIEILDREEVESIAIGFLHSYANPSHEERVAELVSERLPGVSVSMSSHVCPEIREYERLSTTCANAYVHPMMGRYLSSLASYMTESGCRCPLLMMTSGGGLTTLDTAARFPIRLVESGPAGGAILAATIARELQLDRVISFDMGGTTAKICFIDDQQPRYSRSFEVDRSYRFKKGSGLPVRIPVIEMVEIGAGGGSIARVDELRRVQVGPDSAGSEPGPAAYGQGGHEATVTDADVVLGRLLPEFFAAGQMRLDVAAANRAIKNSVSDMQQSSNEASAYAVSQIVDENMAACARGHGAESGLDVSGRTMIAFGGAAPIHAASLMQKLNLQKVVIPTGAGVGSAIGFLRAPIAFEVVRSRYMRLSEFDEEEARQTIDEMRTEADAVVQSASPNERLYTTAHAYMRYVGQGYEVSVPVTVDSLQKDELTTRFNRTYSSLYGRTLPDSDVEILSWTLTSHTQPPDVDTVTEPAKSLEFQGESGRCALSDGEETESAIQINREQLGVGEFIDGPAVVTESHTTTVVPRDYRLSVNGRSDLVMERTEVNS